MIAENRYLLLAHGVDPAKPDDGDWWLTPGGGLEADETPAEAARRELIEETGYDCGPLGESVYDHVSEFSFGGVDYAQQQSYFVARIDARYEVDRSQESPLEQAAVTEFRWWPIDELATTTETLFPHGLADLMREVVQTYR